MDSKKDSKKEPKRPTEWIEWIEWIGLRFLLWIEPFARRLSAGSRPGNQRAGDSLLLAPLWRPPSHANSTNPASRRASPTVAAGAAASSSLQKASRPAE